MQAHHEKRIRLILLAAILLVALLLTGCATGGGGSGHNHSRGSVSDAAAQSAEESESGRDTGHTRTRTDHQDNDTQKHDTREYYTEEAEDSDDLDMGTASFIAHLLVGIFGGGDSSGSNYRDDTDARHDKENVDPGGNLVITLSRANPAGDTIKRMSTASVMYSNFRSMRWRTHVGLYYGNGRKGSHPDVQGGIKSISEFGLDIGGREYLTPRYTFVGFYIIGGLRVGGLGWSYNEAVPVPSENGTETITSDMAFIITPYLGIGSSIVQVKPLHIGASLTWGMRFVGDRTLEEFDNDLFRDTGELRLNLETSFFF